MKPGVIMHVSKAVPSFLFLALAAACGDSEPPVVAPGPKPTVPPTEVVQKEPPPPLRFAYPPAAKKLVENDYFGTKVADAYQWLEDGKNPEVQKFSDAQNSLTRSFIDGSRDREKVRARVAEIIGAPLPKVLGVAVRGDKYFLLKYEPPKQQPFLVARTGDQGTDTLVLDPATYDATGKTTIDMFVPSPDGKRVAISLSSGGSESGDVHVFDATTGAESKIDTIPRAYGGTAGGSLAWDEKGAGFFYTRYPREGERPKADLDFYTQAYFHKLGTAVDKDTYEIGKDFPKIAEIVFRRSPDGKSILAEVENGDGGEYMHFIRNKGAWKQLSKFDDKWTHATFDSKSSLFVISRAESATGDIVALERPYDVKNLRSGFFSKPEGALVTLEGAQTTLYATVQTGGPSKLVWFPIPSLKAMPKTKVMRGLDTTSVVATSGVTHTRGDDVLFYEEGYTIPGQWQRYHPGKEDDAKDKALVGHLDWNKKPTVDLSDAEVTREMCISKDGTKVPVNIVHKKGIALDGEHPTLLTGYGGYGLSRTPRFRSIVRMWIDHGGVYADANLRGGSEFGDDWHRQGALTKKQNVFDDFFACSDLLVQKKFTSPAKLAIMGGSNGGLLMGAAFTQHPEKYRAVIAMVGIYDMLRVETTPNGQFNIPEFGTVKNEEQFRALNAYSPLHHVTDKTAYPAILFTTGENDPRVDPFHSRKMVARMQAATSSDRPILLRTSKDTGHGMGTPLAAEIQEATDIYTFLFRELNVEF